MKISSENLPENEGDKKRRLWRKLFLLNLCITLALVASFWLPEKLVQLNNFLDSPSVDIPGEGKIAKNEDKKAEPAPLQPENLLNTQVVTVNA